MTYYEDAAQNIAQSSTEHVTTAEVAIDPQAPCLVLPSLLDFQTSEVLDILRDFTPEEVARLAQMNVHTLKKWEQDDRGHKFSDGGLKLLEKWLVHKFKKAASAAGVKVELRFR